MILDLDINIFILHSLISLTYPIIMDALECIEYLCSYKVYFEKNQAIITIEILLKSIYFQIKQDDHNDYLKRALELLIHIVPRLNSFYITEVLPFERIIDTTKDLLDSKENPEIICATIRVFSTLLIYKPLQKYLNENILNNIVLVWHTSGLKLSEIYKLDKKNVVIALCVLCDNSLTFSQKILNKINKACEYHNIVKRTSVRYLEIICIPYIADIGSKNNDIYPEYLCFLETLFKMDLSETEFSKLCKQLILEKNFNTIAKYINLSSGMADPENCTFVRQYCVSLISEIIANVTKVNNNDWPHTKNKYKKYLLKGLEVLPYDIYQWFPILGNFDVAFQFKLPIITFSCFFYIHSNNLGELKSSYLNHIVAFVTDIPFSIQLTEIFLKDLWLLFAILYSSFPEEAGKIRGLRKANIVLQRLILTHTSSLEKVLTYHPSIIYWTCSTPGMKRQMQLEVFAFWLKKAQELPACRSALISATRTCNKASYILLYLAKKGAPEYALSATEILRISLESGCLSHNEKFVNMLCMYVSESINEISKENIVRERVVNAIYMLQLGSYISEIPDIAMIEYSISNFTHFLGAIGINELLPSVFYVKAFEYTNGILSVAKQHRIQQVFITFMNSEKTLYVFMSALLSGNLDISIGASKIFINLLEFQNNHQLTSQKNLTVHNNSLIKLLSTTHQEQLLLNLEILYKVLNFYTLNPVLKVFYPVDNNFIKGLYLRCLNLSCKPGFQEISEFSYKCLQAILAYSKIHHPTIHECLCNHPGNHTLILIYFDKGTSRPLDTSFLTFVQSWLYYAGKNKEKIFNKLSINFTLWRMSLIQITNQITKASELSFNKSTNIDLIYSIASQITVFAGILPESFVCVGIHSCFLFTIKQIRLLSNIVVNWRTCSLRNGITDIES
ncbi:hypothetical protein CBL_05769 [Carabus blaptoides fortunei]